MKVLVCLNVKMVDKVYDQVQVQCEEFESQANNIQEETKDVSQTKIIEAVRE